MGNELQLWTIDGESGEVVQVETRNRTDTERLLEDVIAKQPNMLMPGVELVGRQTPAAGGNLDLLGVDTAGRLIVFELKRGPLTRDAVTQVIDYASDLEARDVSELSEHIAARSGNLGIDRIDDFEEWYNQRFDGQNLKPVRMALVGLGVDDNATRMVAFLAERGVEIELLTFHAYQLNGTTLLARQAEQEPVRTDNTKPSHAERRRVNEERIRAMGIPFWDDMLAGFQRVGNQYVHIRTGGWAFGHLGLRLPEERTSFSVSHAVRAISPGTIRVTFCPIAVHLCSAEFERAKESIPFRLEPPSNAPTTTTVLHQWSCELDEAGWNKHGQCLIDLASNVYTNWYEARRATV